MNIRHRFWTLLVAAPLLGAIAGCGSTPQAALDQANHGAALTAALDAELKALRTAQAGVAQSRLDSIRRLNTSVAQYDAEAAFDERVQKAANKPAHAQLYKTLQELGDSRARDEEALQAALAQADADYAKLLAPAPDPGGQLQATRQALMALSEQLSLKERLALTAGFAKTVRKAVKDQKQEQGSTP